MEDEVVLPATGDPPLAVVERHVVIPAQQYSSVDIRASLILGPFVDVVRFTVRRRPIASFPPASTVADRERDALSRGEQALLPHESTVTSTNPLSHMRCSATTLDTETRWSSL
ncbi:hypothetical protein DC31_02150 [Microbacterium sp. CH12i]|nr:hypothetical protein DC31_02150 [Microbacterium sp. CH12i]